MTQKTTQENSNKESLTDSWIDLQPSHSIHVNMCAKPLQSCPTHCDPVDCSLLVSSKGSSMQEYRSELPCPPPETLPDPGIYTTPLTSPAPAG